jgi:hypothetical protein
MKIVTVQKSDIKKPFRASKEIFVKVSASVRLTVTSLIQA